MLEKLLTNALQYTGYLVELGLFLYILVRGQWRRVTAPWLYVGALLLVDGIARPSVLYSYGATSREYAYFYWLTDVLLGLAVFGLTCALFRRTAQSEIKLWRHLRLLLSFVLVLVVGISAFSLSRNLNNLFTAFIVEFQQNLYFTCLVLITLLYLLVQRVRNEDEELNLLVAGLGIQLAGPAACLALFYVTSGQEYARTVWNWGAPLSNLAMLSVWFYALAWAPKTRPVLEEESEEFASAVVAETR